MYNVAFFAAVSAAEGDNASGEGALRSLGVEGRMKRTEETTVDTMLRSDEKKSMESGESGESGESVGFDERRGTKSYV